MIHLIAAMVVMLGGLLTGLAIWEWVVIMMMIGMVIAAEILNSAIENLADALTTEYNDHIRKAKDMAAAAVMVLSVVAIIVACLVFIPKWI